MKPKEILSQVKSPIILSLLALVVLGGAGALLWPDTPKPEQMLERGLPTLGARGSLPALHTAMTSNPTLKAKVEAFCDLDESVVFLDRQTTDHAVSDILLIWAGIDPSLPPGPKTREGIHPHIDTFLRKAYKMSPATPIKNHPLLGEAPWPRLFQSYKTRLIAQCAGRQVFDGDVRYDHKRNRLSVDGTLSQSFVDGFAAAVADRQDRKALTTDFLVFIDAKRDILK